MENQISVGDQNTQQIGQNPLNLPVFTPEKPKNNYLVIGLVILVCFILFGLGGYYLGSQSSAIKQNTRLNQSQSSPTPTIAVDPMANWKTYTNTKYEFNIRYPSDWVVVENPINDPRAAKNSIRLSNNMSSVYISFFEEYGGACTSEYQKIMIDNQSHDVCISETGAGEIAWEQITFQKSKNIIELRAYSKKSTSEELFIPQILSTFKFLNSPKNTVTVKLYYHDSKLDPNTDFCEANNYIEKDMPKTNTPIKDTINTLIRSDIFEKDDRFVLKGINLKQDGTLILEFPWIGGFTTGGSCRIGILTSQIEKTALQFSEVKKVTFEPEVFQP